ncbi:MAG: hypothetical protein IJR17_02115 [Clostridia bacterium]|nr:hypothetical protein [Clostridia bacterium]
MYLYQPCLIALALYLWAEGDSRRERLGGLLPLGVLIISDPSVALGPIILYPAGLLSILLAFLKKPRHLSLSVIGAVLGGMICWKVADRFPLMPGLLWLCGGVLAACCFLCPEPVSKLQCAALGSLLFEVMFCLREYMLFGYCQLRLSSKDSLSAFAASVCLLIVVNGLKTLGYNLKILKKQPI